jgi:hypothetical protein
MELPPSGLFQLQLGDGAGAEAAAGSRLGQLRHHPWPPRASVPRQRGPPPPIHEDGPETADDGAPVETAEPPPEAGVSAELLLAALDEAVRRRVESAPAPTPAPADDDRVPSGARVAVLFSGGVDCMVIAALAHRHRPAGRGRQAGGGPAGD